MPLRKQDYTVTITTQTKKVHTFSIVATSEARAIMAALKTTPRASFIGPITIAVTPLGRHVPEDTNA